MGINKLEMGSGKPRGIQAARKLRVKRRLNRWADLGYKKAHQTSKWKEPFMEASHAAGIVVEKVGVECKQPNSGVRKCVRVQLKKNNNRITAYVPRDGGMSFMMRTTKFWLPVSVDQVTQRVISQVLDSRSSRLLVAVFTHFGLTKRKSQWHEE